MSTIDHAQIDTTAGGAAPQPPLGGSNPAQAALTPVAQQHGRGGYSPFVPSSEELQTNPEAWPAKTSTPGAADALGAAAALGAPPLAPPPPPIRPHDVPSHAKPEARPTHNLAEEKSCTAKEGVHKNVVEPTSPKLKSAADDWHSAPEDEKHAIHSILAQLEQLRSGTYLRGRGTVIDAGARGQYEGEY